MAKNVSANGKGARALVPLDERGLSPQEAVFVDHYATTLDLRAAASEANLVQGKSQQRVTLISAADKMLGRRHVQEAILEAIQARVERIRATPSRVVDELAKVAFANIRDYLRWDAEAGMVVMAPSEDISELDLAAVAQVEERRTTKVSQLGTETTTRTLSFKLHDKLRALEQLGRILMMFRDGLPDPLAQANAERRLEDARGERLDQFLDMLERRAEANRLREELEGAE